MPPAPGNTVVDVCGAGVTRSLAAALSYWLCSFASSSSTWPSDAFSGRLRDPASSDAWKPAHAAVFVDRPAERLDSFAQTIDVIDRVIELRTALLVDRRQEATERAAYGSDAVQDGAREIRGLHQERQDRRHRRLELQIPGRDRLFPFRVKLARLGDRAVVNDDAEIRGLLLHGLELIDALAQERDPGGREAGDRRDPLLHRRRRALHQSHDVGQGLLGRDQLTIGILDLEPVRFEQPAELGCLLAGLDQVLRDLVDPGKEILVRDAAGARRVKRLLKFPQRHAGELRMIREIDELLRLLADVIDERAQTRDRGDRGDADAGDRQRHPDDRITAGLRGVAGAAHGVGKAIRAGRIGVDHELGNDLRHRSALWFAKEIVEHFDQLDLEWRQAHAGQPDEGVQIRPGDRLDRETRSPARVEPAERVPDVLELERQRRRREFGLELGALVRLVRPFEQALKDLPIWDTILKRDELERLFGECPQLVAEG